MEVQCLALKDLTSPRKRISVHEEEEDDEGQSEHKENLYTGRRSTPLKSAEAAVPALLINRRGATPDLAHITPSKHGTLAEPWTPTANLKMLISAASPDIRDREMKKVLFRPMENDQDATVAAMDDPEADDLGQLEAVDEEEEDAEKKPSRKQKSLGLLSQKFLALYPDYPPTHTPISISLDEVANSLGVERRRIYDIVNVLESLMIVGRIAKNSYTWYGRRQLESTLQDLQQRGLQQGYHLQMELTAQVGEAGPGCEEDGAEGDAANAGSNRKDKSLRIMSQKFVMLFLVSKTQTVTLDTAAKVLIEEGQDSSSHSKYKTKVRRLYDIANVLTSLGLIKKVHVREERGRKPAFKWLGPVDFGIAVNAGNPLNVAASAAPGSAQELRRKMARHASFQVTPTSAAVQRQVSSAPSSPRRDLTGLLHQPVEYCRNTVANTAVCRLQFGNSADPPLQTINAPAKGSVPPSSTLLTPHLFTSLAYLPGLSQPSVVMLYRAPEKPDHVPDGLQSPRLESEEGRKRRKGNGEEETVVKKRHPALEDCNKMRAEAQREAVGCLPTGASPSRPAGISREQVLSQGVDGSSTSTSTSTCSSDHGQPSHYLYVPNNAGLNSLNFLLSAAQASAGVAVPPSGVPTLALPYVLVPSTSLSHYPLVAGSLQQHCADAHPKLSFSVPAVMPPPHFMVGASPYGLTAAPDIGGLPASSPSTPEQRRLHGAGTSHSPCGQQQQHNVTTEKPRTPHTPKEAAASSSVAFFQTPGTLGSVVSPAPATRKRASAQRRLDIGHPLSS